MARIRTIKPEAFLNEDLWDLAEETGLPIFQAYVGLWTQADREGRFDWKPRRLKAAILPYWDGDFSRVLDACLTRGFLVKYASQGREYGCIPTFKKHQVINNRESESSIPPPPETTSKNEGLTREARVDNATSTREVRAQAEGKGKEGKGSEGSAPTLAYSKSPPPDWIPDEILPGQARPASGIDLDLELMNFRAHTFNSAKPESAWQGEWIKWINRAKPNSGPANKPSTGIEAPPRTKDNVWTSP